MSAILTTLSYSGGVQSHAILEMVLRGHIEKPEHFLVLNADPGMEDSRSYEFVKTSKARCEVAGIDFITAKGGSLFDDLVSLGAGTWQKGRMDNPPYWTKDRVTGKIAKLRQGCTGFYKIAPMKRAMREYLHTKFNVSRETRRPPGVESWIGFAADEAKRRSPSRDKYITLTYPLIERGYDRAKVEGYYLQHGIEKPPRSVCVACFANGLSHFEDMYVNRYDDWLRAVAVDESIRDMSQVGVKDECFVSSSCVPLKDLPALNFKKKDADYREHRCNSGACFI